MLTSEFFPNSSHSKDSLAELWSGFLEHEAKQGMEKSRTPSVASSSKPG